jgi:hypothetical protein
VTFEEAIRFSAHGEAEIDLPEGGTVNAHRDGPSNMRMKLPDGKTFVTATPSPLLERLKAMIEGWRPVK